MSSISSRYAFSHQMKQSTAYVSKFSVSLGFPNFYVVPPEGLSGGVALFWKNSIDVSILYQDARLIDCHVNDNISTFYFSCIYGHPDYQYRSELWNKIEDISLTRNEGWLLMGDFN